MDYNIYPEGFQPNEECGGFAALESPIKPPMSFQCFMNLLIKHGNVALFLISATGFFLPEYKPDGGANGGPFCGFA
jgi:hypothetical protein